MTGVQVAIVAVAVLIILAMWGFIELGYALRRASRQRRDEELGLRPRSDGKNANTDGA